MIKRLVYFCIALLVLFVVSYFPHAYFLSHNRETLHFSLLSIYLYHLIAAAIVYAIVEGVAYKLPNQVGYAYLASIFLKLGFFVLIFRASVFSDVILSKVERLSLVIPLFLFLILEAVFISKLLNNK